jgi:hypothetical protein
MRTSRQRVSSIAGVIEMKDRLLSERRALLGIGLAAAGGAICARASAQQPKITKSQASYQDKPKGEQQCDGCTHFMSPDNCKLVEGKISQSGWCTLYAAKPK